MQTKIGENWDVHNKSRFVISYRLSLYEYTRKRKNEVIKTKFTFLIKILMGVLKYTIKILNILAAS